MILYHGTILEYAINIGIDVSYKAAKRGTDFGIGFYTTNFYKLAVTTAYSKKLLYKDKGINNTPVVIEMKYDISNNKYFISKNFNTPSHEWKEFVCINRFPNIKQIDEILKTNEFGKYDIICGPVADSAMSEVSTILRKNDYNLTDIVLDSIRPYKIDRRIATQISFHNQMLADYIKVMGYKIV